MGLADGHDVELVEHERLGLLEDILGSLGEHVVLADEAVDDRTRGLALAEALEAILVGDVLVSLLDGGIDISGGDGNDGLELVVLGLGGGDGDLQRSSWMVIPWAGVTHPCTNITILANENSIC